MTARFGGWGRILHGLVLGFFQPVVPITLFVLDDSKRLVLLLGPIVPIAILIGLGLLIAGRVSLRELGWTRPSARDLLLGIVGLAFYLVVFAIAVRALGDGNGSQTLATAASYPIGTRLWFLAAGAHIAFFEETIFRGYLQPAIVSKLGLAAGVLVTAVIFAAWHPPHFTNVLGFVVRLALGLATGLLRGADRPLFGAFLAHALLWPVVGLA